MSATRSAETVPSGLLAAPSPASGPRPNWNPSGLVTELHPVPRNSPLTTQKLSLLGSSSRAHPPTRNHAPRCRPRPRQSGFFTTSKLGPPYVIGVRAVPAYVLPGREHQNGARTCGQLNHGSGPLVPFWTWRMWRCALLTSCSPSEISLRTGRWTWRHSWASIWRR